MNYPYANGYIKAIEDKLLDKSKLAKLCKTEKRDFYQALLDMGYGSKGSDIEELIESELADLREIIDEITPEKKYTDLFFLAIDAINIKAYYKMKLLGKIDPDFYTKTGNLPKDKLQKAIFENDYSNLSKTYQKFLIELDEDLKGIENPRTLSAKIDNAIFNFIHDSLFLTYKPALKTYFKLTADFKNTLSLIRSRKLNWELNEFEEMFIANGEIPFAVFESVYSESEEKILLAFRNFHQEKIYSGLKRYFENEDLDALENYFDILLLDAMKAYRYDSLGIGPMFYYYLVKQAEAKNIKIIYASEDPDLSSLIEY
ncbi:MAG TPA: V-type ATPase subunit [Acholeplasmataceae bacterium]|jgi:V/A-type H+-transporting ATPase subunit C|nr:V-type ATPase subunit [Acholeplasmataceae bacterium]